MDFDSILKNLMEKAISCFNSGDYNALDAIIIDNIQFSAPEYKNNLIQENAICITHKEELFKYWKRMHSSYPFKINDFEFIEIGKISKFRNFMTGIDIVIDAEVHFNEYGKVSKINNTIPVGIKKEAT